MRNRKPHLRDLTLPQHGGSRDDHEKAHVMPDARMNARYALRP
jgi:hypothetical protein